MEKPWGSKWKIKNNLSGGGQCHNYLVKSLFESDQKDYVLKTPKDNASIDKRRRFYQEVHNNIVLDHAGIPKIVDHNCVGIGNTEILYLVYEYIDGLTLEGYIMKYGQLNFDDSIELIIKLLEILEHCHENNIIHRDIKPDNIIMKGESLQTPIFIDFGLSANGNENPSQESGDRQLGNRFLHLPELNNLGSDKRDPRSDITYTVGVFFYILTGEMPITLISEKGAFPHQRINISKILKDQNIDDNLILIVNNIFDIGFQSSINNRFQTIEQFRDTLQRLKSSNDTKPFDARQYLKDLAPISLVNDQKQLEILLPAFRTIFAKVAEGISSEFPSIEVARSGPSIQSHHDPIRILGHYNVTDKFSRKVTKNFLIEIVILGTEFILSIDSVVMQRLSKVTELSDTTVKTISDHVLDKYADLRRLSERKL